MYEVSHNLMIITRNRTVLEFRFIRIIFFVVTPNNLSYYQSVNGQRGGTIRYILYSVLCMGPKTFSGVF
jgi:hypothetical protein